MSMRELTITNNTFVNKNFEYDGTYLHYNVPCEDANGDYCTVSRFVARFKFGGVVAFKKFLRDNFSVNEYFKMRDKDVAPLNILETKGYVSPKVCNVLKSAGYPLTLAGKAAYLRDKNYSVEESHGWVATNRSAS